MNFLWFYISPEHLDFWGAIIGATLGGIIGILSAFYAAWYAANKAIKQAHMREQKEKDKERKDKEEAKLTEYRRACLLAETSLYSHITDAYTNIRILEGCVKSIKEQAISASRPRKIVFDDSVMYAFRNQELVTKWLGLGMQVKQVNNLVDDFKEFYAETTGTVHKLQLSHPTGSKPENYINAPVLQVDYAIIEAFGLDNVKATKQLIDGMLGMMALISHHAQLPTNNFKSIEEMNIYSVPLNKYEKELAELEARFNPEKMFKNISEL